MENIFDLFDLSDIPSELGDIKKDELTNEILSLFKLAGRELSVDEVTVAHFRKYVKDIPGKEMKTKTQIMNKLYKISREPNAQIESVKGRKGVYALRTSQEVRTEEPEKQI